eukprot:TRINITY_DN12156_c0_g1_i2.p1 TRINITY_DN12156_c0_g1~~TRINITY_DN12156_c0_g1_i2.p1  ORF type:complete len:3246 (-),score=521.31 TRINITY_DN12156_c0_g1_i2:104-8719(-)
MACYCPNFDFLTGTYCNPGTMDTCCDASVDYIQMFGRVYYWTVRICDGGADPTAYSGRTGCASQYMRVVPQQKFVLRIQCPPGKGCMDTNDNRIKFLLPHADNDKPNWDTSNGCKTNPLETDAAVWPSKSNKKTVGGESRLDYKVWYGKQVKINLSLNKKVDICFANTAPESPLNWFRIGSIRTSSAFGLASKSAYGGAGYKHLKYVGDGGTVTLYGGIVTTGTTLNPYDGNRYSGKALLNIISYDREPQFGVGNNKKTLEVYYNLHREVLSNYQEQMDIECQREKYSSTLVEGAWSKFAAKTYMADIPVGTVDRYHTFSGIGKNQQLKVTQAGVIALCYCAMINGKDECSSADNWLYMGKTTIRGPTGGQSWIFPTNIVVSLQVTGWGLSGCDASISPANDCERPNRDRLRIIDASVAGGCTASGKKPTGYTGYKVGCPNRVGGCRAATDQQDLYMYATTSKNANAYIAGIQVGMKKSVLSFTGDITDHLETGSMITIESSTVKMGSPGKVKADLPAESLHELYKLTGEYDFQDDPAESFWVSQKVSTIEVTTAGKTTVQKNQLSIPVGWTKDPIFTFADDQGEWKQRDKIYSAEEIKGTTPMPNLKVCWGIGNGGLSDYYAEAGELTFVDPPLMSSVTVSLTSKMNEVVAPVVISIDTSDNSEYSQASGLTQLILRFLDTSSGSGKLVPRFSGQSSPTGSEPEDLANNEIAPESMGQWVCGRLFLELWSEAADGFPLPVGCYYGKRHQDVGDTKFYRELVIRFGQRAGFRQNSNYQIVLNAQVRDLLMDDNSLLHVYAMCAEVKGCQRPYMVFEKGIAVSKSATEAAAEASSSQWGENGFMLQRGDPVYQTLDLTDLNIIQIKLTGGDGVQAIQASQVIKIYLWPVTLWNIGSGDCAAECRPYHGSNSVCGGSGNPVMCKPEEVIVGSSRRNVIRLTLPSQMEDITSSVQHTIKITGLTLPTLGFFPNRLGAELRLVDGSSPTFTTSAGYLMKQPEEKQTTGRLVMDGPTGYGPHPFAGDLNNKLYMRLQFGATLWHNAAAFAASFSVQLPPDYTCTVPDDGIPPLDLGVFQVDDNKDGYTDYGRGYLKVSGADGDWSNSNLNVCVYELRANNAIFARQVAYVKVTVNNPQGPMQKVYDKNVWKIKISGKGVHEIAQYPWDLKEAGSEDKFGVKFITLAEEKDLNDAIKDGNFWASNSAVISKLSDLIDSNDPVIQPTEFRISQDPVNLRTQYIRIFFRSGINVGPNGIVIVDAPPGYNFRQACSAKDLASPYYDFIGQGNPRLSRLRHMSGCIGEPYPSTPGVSYSYFNRARQTVGGAIMLGSFYGFEIRVDHPLVYDVSQHFGWYLWTQDSNSYPLEGAYSTIRFNRLQGSSQKEFYHESFGLFKDNCNSIGVEVVDRKPKSITLSDTDVIVYPILFPAATDTSLRITAPLGYTWNTDVGNSFQPTTNGTTLSFTPLPTIDPGAPNQLIFQSLSFQGNQKYGFRAKVAVPDYSPVTSSNAFFLEWGYQNDKIDGLPSRQRASAFEAPPVRALTSAGVAYASNLLGYQNNYLEFFFRTVTTLYNDEGVIIEGDSNTVGFTFKGDCNYLEESDPIPSDARCLPKVNQNSMPEVHFKATGTPIPRGFYKLELPVVNPSARIIKEGVWTFGSWAKISNYPLSPAIDKSLDAPGFVINGPIGDARLMDITNDIREATLRNDRPGKPNQLIFRFSVLSKPTQVRKLTVRGPRGFDFDEDCTDRVIISPNEVFGPNSASSFPLELMAWPTGFEPSTMPCVGNGREAQIQLPVGLEKSYKYAFRIGVRSNPPRNPEWNYWSIDYNQETSTPFLGFEVWTNTGMEIIPSTKAKSPASKTVAKTVNPVQIKFTPFSTVSFKPPGGESGGVVRLKAPPGFLFEEKNGECTVMLEEQSGDYAFASTDMKCMVDNGMTMILENVGNRPIRGGTPYILSVFVFNPPSTNKLAPIWHMDTYTKMSMEPSTALDESTVKGFPIDNVLNDFSVTNTNGIYNGRTKVDDVSFKLVFPDPIKDNDVIIVHSPRGFNIGGNPAIRECNDFRWPPGENPLPTTGNPLCDCEGEDEARTCTLAWEPVLENKDPALKANAAIQFKIATENPARTPFVTQNFWRVQHLRGAAIQSSHVFRSWDINPQLEDVDIELVGANQAAGMESDLEFTFTPVNDAKTIKIEAVFPTEFNFDMASVSVPMDIDQRSEKQTIIINRVAMQKGRRLTIRINSVRLGRGGGQTTFNIVTYANTLPLDMEQGEKRDEKLSYKEGFRLPGQIEVTQKALISGYKEQQQLFPVKSLFQPRVDEEAKAEFTLTFSQRVQAAEKLIIASEGEGKYTLKASPFVVIGTGQVETWAELMDNGELQAELKPGRPASETALQRDTPYKIIMWVVPKTGTANTWRFTTSDGKKYPTNTNDGSTTSFNPVEQMGLTVETQRSPPRALINVVINVDPGSAVIRELLIIAPPAFIFPASGCGDMCQAGQALGSTGRRTATISSPTGEPLTKLSGLNIRVNTPEYTPDSITWFVEGRGQGVGTTTGWGWTSGFVVKQMANAQVMYPGVASLKGAQITFRFSLDVDAGTQIAVEPPTGYMLTCSTEGALRQISLPGKRPDCVDDPLELLLDQTLTVGEYAFGLSVDLPPETPTSNYFNIIIRNKENQVVDAAFQIDGQLIRNTPVTDPTLSWSNAEPGADTIITVGLTFTQTYTKLKALLLNFPEKFIHDVQRPTEVHNLNKQFRVRAGQEWADTTFTDRLKILLDDSNPTTTVDPDTYQFSFPALVPCCTAAEMPRNNVWYLSLCSDYSCKQPGDSSVIITLPMAGFALNELAPNTATNSASLAQRRYRPSFGLFSGLWVLFAALLVALSRNEDRQ